ncbi:histidinol-phosphatase HisJ [Halobacillus seohaensis]|uniref:Histidinol-phosphatase n=1 Tax=Halobacillus seohaensis TaxID=447421 RepID=A0ABW2EGR1_9BACI
MNDGHIHTPYCPHGNKDTFESYIEHAISLDYSSMSFTEHAPLPASFTDPVPDQDSSMKWEDLDGYIHKINELKKTYQSEITIHLGFEVDFIKGYEQETKTFLNDYGSYIDDSILSVHFLPINNEWYCIDYSPEVFLAALNAAGSKETLYQNYFQLLEESVLTNLGPMKPTRIGHMTLIKKFQNLYTPPENWFEMSKSFLDTVKKQGMTLDYNGAGLVKEYCLESYPPASIATLAFQKGIPLIYGSDAHHPKGLKQGYDQLDLSLIRK